MKVNGALGRYLSSVAVMATPPANQEPAAVVKNRLSRIVSRIKRVFKRSDRNAPLPPEVTTIEAAPAAREVHIPTPATVEAPVAAPIEVESGPSGLGAATEEPTVKVAANTEVIADRARRMVARFNVPFSPELFTTYGPNREVSRVYRPIRMRVHRSCHRCNTMFGGNRVCAVCEHPICTLCHTFPKKKTREETELERRSMDMEAHEDYSIMRKQVTYAREAHVGRQQLVRKKVKQRVRRTCHSCQTLFAGKSRICANCQHACCEDCPRSPAKRDKYPYGYPGDEPSATGAIRYTCHLCRKHFPPIPNPSSPEGQELGDDLPRLDCIRCGHTRCDSCPRARPGEVEPGPDAEIVRTVEAKLTALQL